MATPQVTRRKWQDGQVINERFYHAQNETFSDQAVLGLRDDVQENLGHLQPITILQN